MRGIMKDVVKVLVSMLIAYVTFKLYTHATYWNFFIAFIGGGLDAYILSIITNKDN